MKKVFTFIAFIVISSCFISTTRGRHHDDYDDIDDENIDLDHLYSDEDDPPPVPSRYMSMKGDVRQSFALTAAIEYRDQNMLCSPISALLPLGKMAIGANHETLAELLDAVGASRKRKLKSHFKHLIEDLEYLHGVKLSMASRIYLSKYKNLHRKFLDRSMYVFGSTAEKVDFDHPDDAAYIINTWVSKKTDGMIQDLISPTQINPGASLILVNAIYFAGQWKEPFDKVTTGIFYTPSGEKQVPMMSKYAWFNYHRSKTLGAQLVELPYSGDGASFVILLPYKKNGLPALLSQLKLAPELLNSELSKMSKLKIKLSLPKFKMESKLNLVDLLDKIGVKTIFNSRDSGLKKIVRDETVFVSDFTQKAAIEVTELGTEAAAASVTTVVKFDRIVKFEANRPFLFYIIARREQLFAGTLVNPNGINDWERK